MIPAGRGLWGSGQRLVSISRPDLEVSRRSDPAALRIDLRLPNYWIGWTEGRLAFIARYGRITGDPQCILRVVGLPAVQSEAVRSCG
jgi:hypothetical protein